MLASLAAYYFLAYHASREHIETFFMVYVVLFASFFGYWKDIENVKQILFWAVMFRLVFVVATPAFSDDFYRFLWDGQLLVHGYNPFNHLPPELMNAQLRQQIPLSSEIYSHINSLQRSNYTCYPPLNQLFFAIAAFVGGNNLVANMLVLRAIVFLADIGIILVGIKILKLTKQPLYRISIFAFNPLVINELCGNLHFEGVMMFFLVLGLYAMLRDRNALASILLGMTASIKLIPLMIFPLFMKRKGFVFALMAGLVFLFLFAPVFFLSPTGNFYKSIFIYFHSFEFNASVFYLLRAVGFWTVGYDLVGVIGPVLALVSLGLILRTTYRADAQNFKTFTRALLLCFLIYFSFATTVHPWYIVSLLVISVFSGNVTPLAWSTVIWLSYYSYGNPTFTENPWLLVVEYTVMYAFFMAEYTQFGNKIFISLMKLSGFIH
ncbi:MAG: hypothetical protein AUK44_00885 [Porphyromonadaceae bacterium CG2_30_38_12]|nr:MAG: hypothetical protein AUK44_00885 [Porphyromonadaceae bacterium CG2_30_38_12]